MIKINDFVVFINPLLDEIMPETGEALRYRVIELDGERVLLEAVTPALHIRPTTRTITSQIQIVTDNYPE